jgi:hypothetical protein
VLLKRDPFAPTGLPCGGLWPATVFFPHCLNRSESNLPLDGVPPVWQHQTTTSVTEEKFSLTHEALSTCVARVKRIS